MPEGDFANQDAKCCICFPIKTGMKIMGALYIFDAVLLTILSVLHFATLPGMAAVLLGVAVAVGAMAFQWFKWFKEDSADTRQNVIKGMRIMIFVTAAFFIALTCVMASYEF